MDGIDTLTALLAASDSRMCSTELEFCTQDAATSTTVGSLIERARHVAGGLKELGVGEGDRIAVQMSNRLEAAVLQCATLMLDAVLVPIVPVFGPSDVGRILADAQPCVYVTERSWRRQDYLQALSELGQQLPEHVVVVGGAEGFMDWAGLEAAVPLEQASAASADDVCLIIYTSGSTGMPKGVRHTRRSILAEVLDYDYRPHGDSKRDLYLQGSAGGHIGGYMFLWRAAYYGMKTVVMDGWNAKLACRLVTEKGITAMVGTPFHIISMLEAADADPAVDLSSLAMVMCGGAPVSAELVRRADMAGMNVVWAYGMSEHPTIALGSWRDPLEIRLGIDGYVTGHNEVRFVDDLGDEVPPGQPGEILVRGPEQFVGYTNVEDSEVFTRDGWFPTGDIGQIGLDGRLKVIDRKKNIIIRGGENLSATEIEGVVLTHPSVLEVGVVGVPDDRYGERACAYVVLRQGATLSLEQLREHFEAAGVARQKVPEFLEFRDLLPRTGNGKLRKAALVRQHQTT